MAAAAAATTFEDPGCMAGAALTADAMKTLDESMDDGEEEQSGFGILDLRAPRAAHSRKCGI